jgi:autotransporter passenger strand-loop-strand repeat protein
MTSVPQFVIPGQTVGGIVLTSGGFQFVLSGGQTVGTVINSGGIQLAGGTEDNTTVAGGGLQFVFSSSDFLVFSGLGSSLTSSQISALEANVTSLGTLGGLITAFGGISGFIKAIESGFRLDFEGVARNTTVYSGGIQAVGEGAIATNTTLNSGGFQAVLGGLATSTTVGSGGLQFVGAGQELPLFGSGNGNGEVDGSVVNGGVQVGPFRGHRQRDGACRSWRHRNRHVSRQRVPAAGRRRNRFFRRHSRRHRCRQRRRAGSPVWRDCRWHDHRKRRYCRIPRRSRHG